MLYESGSQTWLHVGITWRALQNTDVWDFSSKILLESIWVAAWALGFLKNVLAI